MTDAEQLAVLPTAEDTAGMLPGSSYNRWKSSITSAADALCCLCGRDLPSSILTLGHFGHGLPLVHFSSATEPCGH